MALGLPITGMERGPVCPACTRGPRGFPSCAPAPGRPRPCAWKSPQFVDGYYGIRGTCFQLIPQTPEPHSYPSGPEQGERQHRNPKSQEVKPPTLAWRKARGPKRLIRERMRERSGPRSHRIKGRAYACARPLLYGLLGIVVSSPFFRFLSPRSVAPGAENPI